MRYLLPTVGGAVLLLLGVDVFLTVFHPEGRGGPFSGRISRLVWRLFRRFGVRRDGRPRERLLSLAGPLLAVLAPASWILVLIVGFALVYYPFMSEFLVSPGTLRAPWAEALYFSGYAAATLGLGDVVADSTPLRLAMVVESISGFALLTAGLTYILAVYRQRAAMAALSSEVLARVEWAETTERAWDGDLALASWDGWLQHVARELTGIRHAQAQYPIVQYFREMDERNALAVQLGRLLDILRAGSVPGQPQLDLRGLPGYGSMDHALRTLFGVVERDLLPDGTGTGDPDLERLHGLLMGYMGYPARRALATR